MNKTGAGSLRSRDDSQSQRKKFFDKFRWERRPSDKHREFIEQLQFPKGNNPKWGGMGGLGLGDTQQSPVSRGSSVDSQNIEHNQVVRTYRSVCSSFTLVSTWCPKGGLVYVLALFI